MRISCIKSFVIFLVIALVAVFLAAPQPALAEDEDKILYKQLRVLIKKNDMLGASKLALKMAPYEGSEYYEKAAAILLKRGISINDPLASYTVQQMIRLQNECERHRHKTNELPRAGSRSEYQDGWGKAIRVEMVTKKTYLYLIRSAGADGIWLSEDDPVIGARVDDYKSGRSMDYYEDEMEGKDAARKAGKSSLIKGSTRIKTGADTFQPPSDGIAGGGGKLKKYKPKSEAEEQVIEIEDLLTE